MNEYREVDTFNVIISSQIVEEIEGRANAVARAKELSSEGQRVSLDRTDNMVTMQFSEGSLETYVCETRDRKPRRRERGDERDTEMSFEGEDQLGDDSEFNEDLEV